MPTQYVLYGEGRVDAEQFAKVWMQWEVDLSLLEEPKHSFIFLLEDRIEGVFVIVDLLV